MEPIGITTPAILFPAISLLLLAFTNRFLAITSLVRSLYKQYHETADQIMKEQIENLRMRIRLIRLMQLYGVASFISVTLTMILLLIQQSVVAYVMLGLSLILLLAALVYCFMEIYVSGRALNLQLENLGSLPAQDLTVDKVS